MVQEFREKKTFRRLMESRLTLFFLVILVLVLSRSVFNIYMKERSAEIEKKSVLARAESLSEREAFLSKEVSKLKTENGIEQEIRDKYNVKRAGEEVIIIVDSTTTKQLEPIEKNFLGRVADWFQSIFD